MPQTLYSLRTSASHIHNSSHPRSQIPVDKSGILNLYIDVTSPCGDHTKGTASPLPHHNQFDLAVCLLAQQIETIQGYHTLGVP